MTKFMLRRLGVADDPGSLKPTLQGCLEAVLEQSDTLMDAVLSGLKVSLEPPKGKHSPLPINGTARETIELLLDQSSSVKAVFGHTLRKVVYGGDSQRKATQPLVRFDDFQFLEEDQIDANIEFALTQQEVMLAVDDVLPNLNALVSGLLGWVTVQAHLNPLKPESFVHALRESLLEHIPDDAARSSVMTLAAGKMGVSLRQLYREVSDWMRSQGVEAAGLPISTVGGAKGPAKPAENAMSRTLLTLDKLRRLLSGELDPGPMAAGVKDFIHTVPASFDALQDMKMVEPMMKRLAARASLAEAAPASAPVSPLLAAGQQAMQRERTQSKNLGKQLGEEVVRLMLENLLADHRLMAPVRANLKAMEPVLIKLSQGDPRFFSDRQHPARQLLDKLTHRSLAFTSENEAGFGVFRKTFDNAVSVLVGGEGDAASFARVLRKLEEGWARDEHDQRQRAEEAARALLRAEQRNLLAQRLTEEFKARMEGKRVPDMVVNFLRGPWAQVVAEAQLKFADGTGDASDYQALADDLIWSVQLKLARRNRTRLVQMVPPMLVKMRQGLQLISYPQELIAEFFDALITYHEKAFETVRAVPSGTPIDAVVDRVSISADDQASAADSFWMAEDEATDSGFMEDAGDIPLDFTVGQAPATLVEPLEWTVESLNTGSWVDLALAGTWVRAQLTWASPHRTLFMFISGGGMAHSMSRRTMDRLKGLGLIRLVSDGRVMDNALDAVAQTALRNDASRAIAED